MLSFVTTYGFAGDFFSIVLCLSCLSVLRSSYTIKQINLKLYYFALFIIVCSSLQSIIFHAMLAKPLTTFAAQFIFFSCQNSVLIGLQVLLLVMLEYLMNLFFFTPREKWKKIRLWTWPAVLLYGGYKFYSPFNGLEAHLNPVTLMIENYGLQDNVYIYVYGYLFLFCIGTIIKNKKKLIEHVYRCLLANAFLAFFIMVLSYIYNVTTFVCISFTLPVLAVLFLFHYNAYDVKMGTLDLTAFYGYMHDMNRKTKFIMVNLYLKKNPIDKNTHLSQNFLQYVQSMFSDRHDYHLFRISDEQLLLVYEIKADMNVDKVISLLQLQIEYGLKYLYKQYGVPYQLLYLHSHPELGAKDYIDVSTFLSNKMLLNEIKVCSPQDIEDYRKFKVIDMVFQNIQQSNNLDDPRVVVHYQPILDADKMCYKAEALMRLQIEDKLYYPGDFLPVVESENYSHLVTKIILNKVCLHIKELEREGYNIDKISINLSTSDLLMGEGYKDFTKIVEKEHGLSFEKIAFEILEYTDKVDYAPLIKMMSAFSYLTKVEFYLDDFGSGYSNLLRLLSLPVKIIKFDRGILQRMRLAPSTKTIVQNNIQIFIESGYQILFEGVETEEDLALCEELGAHYYQGFYFARPAPLEELKTYLTKAQ